jgi:hypothetical protein
MKNLFRLILIITVTNKLFAGFSNQSSQETESVGSQIFLSSPLNETNKGPIKNLSDTVVSYPLRGILDDQSLLMQGMQNRRIKGSPPSKVIPLFQHSKLSILKATPDKFKNYPTGAELFPNYKDLSSKFDAMINSFINEPDFIPLFRKIHINVLNELYHHLIGIYMNFNLQHQGMIQNTNGDLISDIPTYLQTKDEYDINKKTMIINHLMAIIESQFNGAIQSYVAYIPQSFATYIGRTAIQNDYSTDLTHLVIEQMEPELAKLKKTSIEALANYVSFFQAMTNYLDKKNIKTSRHFNSFVDIAETINTFLYAEKEANQELLAKMKANSPATFFEAATKGAKAIKEGKTSANSWAKGLPYPQEKSPAPTKNSGHMHTDAHLIAMAKMNPPIFHFGYDDIRALKLIPYLAQNLSAKTKRVPWPEHMVEAANEMLLFQASDGPHPIAYFKTKENKVVKNINGNPNISDLYLCMRIGKNLFEQILIQEPEWLSSWEGILKILRACYGDFTAILDMNILDPISEAIIASVDKIQRGKSIDSLSTINQKAIDLINSWKNINTNVEKQTGQNLSDLNLPPLDSLSSSSSLDSSLMTSALVSQP